MPDWSVAGNGTASASPTASAAADAAGGVSAAAVARTGALETGRGTALQAGEETTTSPNISGRTNMRMQTILAILQGTGKGGDASFCHVGMTLKR
ncbi:hypothetical protein Xcc1_30910 [Xanthomonas campestris pv. campestris]|jgi:hypothetical protein|nr:hypothetical protein Xcc1_30910 [Xanthomonas campestris pv. campestris]